MGRDGGMGEQGERKRHTKLAKQNISRVGGTNGFTVWLVDQFSTFTEKNSMTSYLQGNRD